MMEPLPPVPGALGFLELGSNGRQGDRGAGGAERRRRAAGLEDPAVVPWAPDLIDAYARAGRDEDAKRRGDSSPTGRSATRRRSRFAARCRGLVAGDGLVQPFARAWSSTMGDPVPSSAPGRCSRLGPDCIARGAAVEARERFETPSRTFEQLGAAPWAERARAECARRARSSASGSATRRAHRPGGRLSRAVGARGDQPRGRGGDVPEPKDDRVPPRVRVPKAGDSLPRGARDDRVGRAP